MSLASTVLSTAYAGTHSCSPHYSNTSFFDLNSKPKFTHNKPWRHKSLSIISQEISIDKITPQKNPSKAGKKPKNPFKAGKKPKNPSKAGKKPKNPSLEDQLKPFAHEFLNVKPSTNDNDNLNQGLSMSKHVSVNPSRPRTSVLTPQRRRSNTKQSWTPQIAGLRHFVEKIDSCEPTQKAIFEALDSLEEIPPGAKDAVSIINNLQSWEKGYYFFQWLDKNENFQMNVYVYNVTMKVLRSGMEWDRVEELLKDMLGKGIQPDNITYSTVISCARQCNLLHKAVEWFERMDETGCVPDQVTYTAMLDAYSRAGKVREALNMYELARANGWRPDIKAFTILLKMYSISEDFEGALDTFYDMKAMGVMPNVVAYNTMFDVLAKVGEPSVAKALFTKMTDAGLSPNHITVTSLLKIFGKAGWADDALQLWYKIKQEGLDMDLILYNALLSMLSDLGLVEEAVELFKEMQESDNCKPDCWSYSAMIVLYTHGYQTEEVERMYHEMMEAGFRPTAIVCTCLIQCYGRAKRFDDVVRTFDLLLDKGIVLDDKLCGCLLSVLTLCEKEEFGKVLECIEKAHPKLGSAVKMLQQEDITLAVLQEELRTVFNQTSNDARKPFCNCLIDLCYKFNFPERAHDLLYLGTLFGVYTNLHTKSATEWCLNLRSLSFKAALTVFDGWMSNLSEALEDGEEMPPLLGINTGHGNQKHGYDQSLAALFGSHLRELDSPFVKSRERIGWFLATRDAAISWLQSKNLSRLITA